MIIFSAPSFEASEFLITNREFLEFIEAGGYDTEQLWSEEGWKWRIFKQAKHPMFWICNEGKILNIMSNHDPFSYVPDIVFRSVTKERFD